MATMICPNCNALLPPQEIAEGWCETCGKKIPSAIRGELPMPSPTVSHQSWHEAMTYSSLVYRPLASRFARLAAVTIDICLWFSIYALAMTVAKRLYAEDNPAGKEVGESMYLVGLLILLFLQTVFLSIRGQTVGKMVMRIRIVRVVDEANPGFVGAVLYRVFIPGVIAVIPCVGSLFGLVDILYIFANDRRCLHDRIAGTKVVVA